MSRMENCDAGTLYRVHCSNVYNILPSWNFFDVARTRILRANGIVIFFPLGILIRIAIRYSPCGKHRPDTSSLWNLDSYASILPLTLFNFSIRPRLVGNFLKEIFPRVSRSFLLLMNRVCFDKFASIKVEGSERDNWPCITSRMFLTRVAWYAKTHTYIC